MKSIWTLVTALCLICLLLLCAVIYEYRVRPIVIDPASLQPYSYVKKGNHLEWSQSKWTGQPGKDNVTVVFNFGYSPCSDQIDIVVPPSGSVGCEVTAEYGYFSYNIQPGIIHSIRSANAPWDMRPCKPNCPAVTIGTSTSLDLPVSPDNPDSRDTLTSSPFTVVCGSDGSPRANGVKDIQTPLGYPIEWVPGGPNYGVTITFSPDYYPCGPGFPTLKGYGMCTANAPGTKKTYTIHEDSCVGKDGKNHDTTDNTLTVK